MIQVRSPHILIDDLLRGLPPFREPALPRVRSMKLGPLLVALGIFTSQARVFARSKHNLRLIDGSELVDLILQHYERFDSRYKGLLPLKRVYVPEVLEEAQE